MSSTLKILPVPPLLCTALLCAGCGKKAPEAERRCEMIRNDPGSVNRGEELFNALCRHCHEPYSTRMKAGPGLMGILRKRELPSSGRAATPGNIREQLIHPLDHMPSFVHLTGEESADILAFLNTL